MHSARRDFPPGLFYEDVIIYVAAQTVREQHLRLVIVGSILCYNQFNKLE